MPNERSFWSTVPGIITGIAALVTAVGGTLGFLVRTDGGAEASPPAASTPTTSDRPGAPPTTAPPTTAPPTTAPPTTAPPTAAPPTAAPPTAAPSATTTTTTTPVPTGFRVVEASLRADPFEHDGACPVTIRFSGRVSVAGGPGVVSYRLVRSDGAIATVKTVNFIGPGSEDIEETWTRDEGSGWMQLEILDPRATTSGRATFAIRCTG